MSIAVPHVASQFLRVLEAKEPLLSAVEKRCVEQVRALPFQALCLYIHLVRSKETYLRPDRIFYPECQPAASCVEALVEYGFLLECTADARADYIWPYVSHQELLDLFVAPEHMSKAKLCEWLEAHMHQVRHKILAAYPLDAAAPYGVLRAMAG